MLTLSLGTHWSFLQSVAWVGMVVQYSHETTITEALSNTFDGRHPCKLCKFVESGKASEKKQDSQKPVTKLEYASFSHKILLLPPQLGAITFPALTLSGERRDSPPVPPPKRA